MTMVNSSLKGFSFFNILSQIYKIEMHSSVLNSLFYIFLLQCLLYNINVNVIVFFLQTPLGQIHLRDARIEEVDRSCDSDSDSDDTGIPDYTLAIWTNSLGPTYLMIPTKHVKVQIPKHLLHIISCFYAFLQLDILICKRRIEMINV